LPGLQPAAAAERARQRDAADAVCRRAARRHGAPRRGGVASGRSRRPRRPQAGRDVRRAAAARRDRAGAGQRAVDPAGRRAGRRASGGGSMSAQAIEVRPSAPERATVEPPSAAAPDWAILTSPLPADTRGSIALGQSLGSAVGALWSNKMRAVLTMLGIIIGVAAVIIMIALG